MKTSYLTNNSSYGGSNELISGNYIWIIIGIFIIILFFLYNDIIIGDIYTYDNPKINTKTVVDPVIDKKPGNFDPIKDNTQNLPSSNSIFDRYPYVEYQKWNYNKRFDNIRY